MATRQYIGARYVPIFADPIAWVKENSYEALTIVTYLNNSYTSKKPVPANTEITNTEYWAVTGNYNAQIEEYRQETVKVADDLAIIGDRVTTDEGNISALTNRVTNNEENISALTNRVSHLDNRKFIFISDSYGELRDNTSWILKTIDYLGLSSDEYYEAYHGGFGFKPAYNGGDNALFINLLIGLDATITNKSEITDIVVGGGFNDAKQSLDELDAAIGRFCTYAKANYPNAKIWIAGFGWSFNSEFVEDLNHGRYLEAYKRCGKSGATYINGSEYIMHRFEFFKQEAQGAYTLHLGYQYVHPNANGASAIGACVASALIGGNSCGIEGEYKEITLTLNSGITVSGNLKIRQKQSNGNIYWQNGQIILNIPSTKFSYGSKAIEIGTIENGYIAGANSFGFEINTTGFVAGGTASGNQECGILLEARGNRLFLCALTDATVTNVCIFETACTTICTEC